MHSTVISSGEETQLEGNSVSVTGQTEHSCVIL